MSEKIDYKEVMIRMKMDVNYIAEEAYNKGYEEAKLIWSSKTDEESYKRGLHDGNDIGYKDGVNDGRNDAWEAVRKIVLNPYNGGISISDLVSIFGNSSIQNIVKNYSASEVIAELKAYEKKQKADDEVKVGDEVKHKLASKNDDSRGIVTKEWKDVYYIMWSDGSSGRWDKDRIVKTGRHFDIDKILEEMRT